MGHLEPASCVCDLEGMTCSNFVSADRTIMQEALVVSEPGCDHGQQVSIVLASHVLQGAPKLRTASQDASSQTVGTQLMDIL